MDRDEQEPVPVRRVLRSVSPDETPESILPGLPRVASLDALLREVDGLRSTLETDLGRAADAVEAGRPAVAIEILSSDQEHLSAFEHRALGHLVDLAEPLAVAKARRRFRVPVAPFVAAAAVVGFVLSIAPQSSEKPTSELSATTVAANGALDRLQAAAREGDTLAIRATARALHQQLLGVVADAGSDPAAAQRALLLLSYERDAINRSGDSLALHDVLVQSTALANRIRAAMPRKVQSSVPVAPAVQLPTASPAPTSSPTPKATASPSPTSKPTPKPSPSATATSSPSASSGPTNDPGPLSGADDAPPFG